MTVKWQASNDGNSWVDLDTVDIQRSLGAEVTFYNRAGLTEKYKLFRIYVYSANSASSDTSWYLA